MHKLFKGFIRTNGKVAAEKFKGKTDFKTLEEVKNYKSYAGILADDVILVDIDDFEESEILFKIIKDLDIKCRVYETTKGKHFLFLNKTIEKNKTNTSLPISLRADIKCGKNSSYEVLKLDGVERPILLDEEPQEIPYWLHPIPFTTDFKDMEEGEGRNQKMYNYILTLQCNSISVEECRDVLRMINKYVLKNPLDEEELEVIMRDEAFQKPSFYGGANGTTFLHASFSKFLISNNHIVKINGQLHIYKDGVYVPGNNYIEGQMIKHIDNLTKAKRMEVLHYLSVHIQDNTPISDAHLLGFKNGIYDLRTDSFMPFSPDIIMTNKIDWDFVPDSYSELVDNTLNKLACQDKEVRMLLEEAIGYCLYRRNELGKAFILTGDRSNGKSTFLDMIKTMLGENNISSLDLGELGDRFKTAELFGKLANIGDDIGDEFIANPAIFKKLVTGDRLSAERKGQDPFEFNNYSKMLFSANSIPRIRDKTGAVQRRLTIIPFDAKFSINDPDYRPYIKYELREQQCIEYLIQLGIVGLKRILENQKFTESNRVAKELEEYEETNNPILGWLKDITEDEILNEPTPKVYKKYNEYCLANNLQPLSNIEFSKQVKKKFDVDIKDKKVNGIKHRIFVKRK